MKKSPAILALLLAGSLMAHAAQAPPAAGGGQQPQKKEIKDPAEYNAYINAVQASDPNAKIAALEAFLNQYPNSVMKDDALEALAAAYSQTNNAQKTLDTAQRLLQVNPCNLRGLFFQAYLGRSLAEGPNAAANAQYAQTAGQSGAKGLECMGSATKPEGMADADWEKFKTQLRPIFEGSVGFAALQNKDYPAAAQHLQAQLQAATQLQPPPQPADLLRIVYPLAIALLEQSPPNPLGLYYAAEAVDLAPNPQAQQQLNTYARSRYRRYHGSDEGYPELLAQAKTSPVAPAGFTVKPAPTPAEQAAALCNSKAVKDMSFDEIQLCLTAGNQPIADKVWGEIKDKPIAIEGKLTAATPGATAKDPAKLAIAGTAEDVDANKPDIDLTLAGPLPAKGTPQAGTMIQFQGTPRTYTPNPFMVHMDSGLFVGSTAKAIEAANSAKKPPVRKPPAGTRRGATTRKKPSA